MKNLTDITVVLDRSGSMASCAEDTVGGFNTFLKNQKEEKGDARFTLYQFDHEYQEVYQGKPIQEVPDLILGETYIPRGSTALLDAIGRAINTVGERLANTLENERPENVLFIIQTDGEENASKEFQNDKVKEMIKHQEEKYKWNFMFLGANADAFDQAGKMGIVGTRSVNYRGNVPGAYATMSACASSVRGGGDIESVIKSAKDTGDFDEAKFSH